jgi:hypothetical protein
MGDLKKHQAANKIKLFQKPETKTFSLKESNYKIY